jgi:hypothetical protein
MVLVTARQTLRALPMAEAGQGVATVEPAMTPAQESRLDRRCREMRSRNTVVALPSPAKPAASIDRDEPQKIEEFNLSQAAKELKVGYKTARRLCLTQVAPASLVVLVTRRSSPAPNLNGRV